MPSGVPGLLGGLTFLNNNTLLIGGNANASSGAIYQIDVTRGAGNHITGFGSPATLFATAPYIDGGLSFGPGGVIFFTGYPVNTLGEIRPGSLSPDRTIDLSSISPSVQSSVGGLGFVPSGLGGAGGFKLLSYDGGGWYDVTMTADGNGTYDVAATFVSSPGGGPEGIAYVLGSNPGFSGNDSVLVAKFSLGGIEAYSVDSNGDPILGSGQDFLTGLTWPEGATTDPLTGDFLFSTWSTIATNHVDVITRLSPPARAPEPASVLLAAVALAGLGVVRRRGSPR